MLQTATGVDAKIEMERLNSEEPQEPEPRIGEVTADDEEAR